MLDTVTGLITIRSLAAGQTEAIAGRIRELERQGARKLVLDLRNCAVSTPEEGVLLADLFLDSGTIGSLEGQRVPKETFQASAAKTIFKGPLVVLTNRGTAGAAEIAASALMENKRAEAVGERTYGDASLRKAIPTEDGGAVLLAVAKYYSPEGKAIQDVSVTPTHAVADTTEISMADLDEEGETPAQPESPATPEPAEDKILERAIEVLGGKAPAARQEAAQDFSPQLLPKLVGARSMRP